MADEFAKGLAILSGAGMAWLTLAGWYRTPSFEGDGVQLIAPVELSSPTVYDQIGIALMDVMAWFAVMGALTFWVVIPAVEQAREAYAERAD
ncbi:hypothetical protein ACFQMA_21070 [Halosimplex aquaticum]|uniref:DUF7314 domain-containing protein n=1 Tax=Halosimplex aquaticum TaxID=3026162 RepID=A0ABD5Y8Z9_9EURY|nr:hypothetical protein [Halosimplex aquaticum]